MLNDLGGAVTAILSVTTTVETWRDAIALTGLETTAIAVRRKLHHKLL